MWTTRRAAMGFMGGFALLGCAGSEPTQDAAGTPTDETERAPEGAEASALVGHKVWVSETFDFETSGRATLGVLTLDFRAKNDRLIRMECDAVALGSGASQAVDAGSYVVAGVEGLQDREGVNVVLYEHDGKTASDWSIACYTQLRKPLAREIMTAVQKSVAIAD
jgi:hypothetical protein